MVRVDRQMTHIAYAVVAVSTSVMSIIEVVSQKRIDIVVMPIFVVISGVMLGHVLFGNRSCLTVEKRRFTYNKVNKEQSLKLDK